MRSSLRDMWVTTTDSPSWPLLLEDVVLLLPSCGQMTTLSRISVLDTSKYVDIFIFIITNVANNGDINKESVPKSVFHSWLIVLSTRVQLNKWGFNSVVFILQSASQKCYFLTAVV